MQRLISSLCGNLPDFEFSKLRHARDQRDPDAPNLGELELSACDRAGKLKGNRVRASASDLLRQSFDISGKCKSCGDAVRQTVAVGIPARSFLASVERGPVLFRALRRFAAICLSVAMVKRVVLLLGLLFA